MPVNAADTHRVRTSIQYYEALGWKVEVMTVNPRYSDMPVDDLLRQSLPENLIIHQVKAFNKRWTSKFGLGSIALRSAWFFYIEVNRLMKVRRFDLIFFSTTQFPVLALAVFWKKAFKTKIVFDIQDPWHTDYYKHQSKSERPRKFWFSYHLNKILEPIAMQAADGLISVSTGYIEVLHRRYPSLKNKPHATIPFSMHLPDLETAKVNAVACQSLINGAAIHSNIAVGNNTEPFNMVYIGRGGHDLLPAFRILLQALRSGLAKNSRTFQKLKVQLLGTSYAPTGLGTPTFNSEIKAYGLDRMFRESPDRLAFYQTLNTLQAADMLLLLGPNQADYVASKLFPYLMVQRPILAIVHSESEVTAILKKCPNAEVFNVDQHSAIITQKMTAFLENAITGNRKEATPNAPDLRYYSSEHLSKMQTNLFNQVCQARN